MTRYAAITRRTALQLAAGADVFALAGPQGLTLHSAGLLRTARLLAVGEVMVPRRVWQGPARQ